MYIVFLSGNENSNHKETNENEKNKDSSDYNFELLIKMVNENLNNKIDKSMDQCIKRLQISKGFRSQLAPICEAMKQMSSQYKNLSSLSQNIQQIESNQQTMLQSISKISSDDVNHVNHIDQEKLSTVNNFGGGSQQVFIKGQVTMLNDNIIKNLKLLYEKQKSNLCKQLIIFSSQIRQQQAKQLRMNQNKISLTTEKKDDKTNEGSKQQDKKRKSKKKRKHRKKGNQHTNLTSILGSNEDGAAADDDEENDGDVYSTESESPSIFSTPDSTPDKHKPKQQSKTDNNDKNYNYDHKYNHNDDNDDSNIDRNNLGKSKQLSPILTPSNGVFQSKKGGTRGARQTFAEWSAKNARKEDEKFQDYVKRYYNSYTLN